jgi:lipopolysaccharide export system protein LptA
MHMPTHIARKLLLAVLLLAAVALPCRAQSKLLKGDYSFDILRLQSFSPVTTWEQDGVKVFVSAQGATISQGPMRLAAPRMVVWFEQAESQKAGKAIVRVYAEATGAAHGHPATAVVLVDNGEAQQSAALLMTLTSTFSFVADCPLSSSEKPVESNLMSKAGPLLKGAEERTWTEVPEAPAVTPFETAAEGLKADHVEVFYDQSTAVYTGDVHGEWNNLVVRADSAVLWYNPQFKSFEVYAEGNVRLSRKAGWKVPPYEPKKQLAVMDLVEVAKADQIYINPGRARGLATNVEVRAADPSAAADLVYVFRGQKAYLIDDSTLTVRQVDVTTCNFAVPHYQFAADRAQIVRRAPSTILDMWHPKLQVGEGAHTLISLPFIGTDLTQRAYLLESYAFGTSRKYGPFIQTTWRPLDLATTQPTWVESWLVNLDYYGARGPGIGTQLNYKFGEDGQFPRSKGDLTAYFVNDSASEDTNNIPVPQSNRGLIHLRHRTQIDPDWRIDAEYYWLSDFDFLREFFENNFQNDKVPESYLLARYLHGSTYLALLYKQQVNDFIRQVEETPSADLEVAGLPLGPLVYDGQVTGGVYDLEPSSLISPAADNPPSLERLHTQHSVSLPFMIGFLRLDPTLSLLGTWASEGVDAMGDFGGKPSRAGVGAGITASTTLSRVYDVTNDLLDLHRLRHIITPYVDLQTLSVSGSTPDDFIQMDSIDAIDSTTQASIGLRQQVQTKRLKDGQWTAVDWIDSRVALTTQSVGSGSRKADDTFLTWDIDWRLSDHISLHSWDSQVGSKSMDIINVGAVFDWLPNFTLGLDYDYITNLSSVVTAQLFYKLSDRYQLLLKQQTSLNSNATGSNRNLETYVVLRRLFHMWILDIGVHYEQATKDFGVIFGFGPSGFGVYNSPRRAGRI